MSEKRAVINEDGRRAPGLGRRLAEAAGRDRPVLIAGPTASGKSALALEIATRLGGRILNADALQVHADWRILTARPSREDEAAAPHRLYGHVIRGRDYSVGEWLRDIVPLLEGERPIIVGGTGLNFSALTEGLAEIPEIGADIREEARRRIDTEGAMALLEEIDAATAARIDRRNPRRVQRAWEVLRATGRGLANWQDETPPPRLPAEAALRLLVSMPPARLADRIERRTAAMFDDGLLEEARANRPGWSPERSDAAIRKTATHVVPGAHERLGNH